MLDYYDLAHRVEAAEIDAQQHVHNLRYLAWTLRAASRHAAIQGWDGERLEREYGYGWVVREHDITYRAAALADDAIVVRTWISETSRHAVRRRYLIVRPADQTVLARASTRWVMIDMQQRGVVPIPSPVLASIRVCAGQVPPPWSTAANPADSTSADSTSADRQQ